MAPQKTTENNNDKILFAVFGISDFTYAEQMGESFIAGNDTITLNTGADKLRYAGALDQRSESKNDRGGW